MYIYFIYMYACMLSFPLHTEQSFFASDLRELQGVSKQIYFLFHIVAQHVTGSQSNFHLKVGFVVF